MGNLKVSETEEQRKEKLKIGEKKIGQQGHPKLQEEKKWSSETEDNEKQCLATLKRLKRSIVGENTKSGEVVTNKHLRMAV